MKKIIIYILSVLLLGILRCSVYCDIFNITLEEFIYYCNYIPVFLLPAILIDIFSKNREWYHIGINIDKYSIRDIFIGTLMGLVGVGIIILLLLLCRIEIFYSPQSIKSIVNNSIIIFNNVGVEELLFRGFIFQSLIAVFNKNYIVSISALLFALSHLFFVNNIDIIWFINIFIAGILFCRMYMKTKSLWLPFSFHFVWNMSIFLFFEVSADILKYNDSIFNIVLTNKTLLHNLLFGSCYNIESGLLCSLILLLLIYITETKIKPSYKINAELYKQEYLID